MDDFVGCGRHYEHENRLLNLEQDMKVESNKRGDIWKEVRRKISWPVFTFIVGGLATVVFIFSLKVTRIDKDLAVIQSQGTATQETLKRIEAKLP